MDAKQLVADLAAKYGLTSTGSRVIVDEKQVGEGKYTG